MNALATMTGDELAEWSSIQAALAVASPKQRAEELRRRAIRIKVVAAKIVVAVTAMDQPVVSKLHTNHLAMAAAKATAAAAAEAFSTHVSVS